MCFAPQHPKPLRKRRRQAWHAKRALVPKKTAGKYSARKKRSTIDGGKFDQELKAPRKVVTIAEKMKVVRYYLSRKSQKLREQLNKCEPVTRLGNSAGRSKKAVKKTITKPSVSVKNLNKECKERFKEIVGNNSVCRWVKTAQRERWSEIPEMVQARITQPGNTWRNKVGLTPKGRTPGGVIPYGLQKELDLLVTEMVSGNSDVSERREVVTAEDVVSWLDIVGNCSGGGFSDSAARCQ